jgi:hypothetical protein
VRRKKWIIIGVLVAVVVVAAGIWGGVAFAQSGGSSSTQSAPGKSLADRVAAILGIDQSKVESAFTQAERDMQDDALNTWLNNQVAQGKMTQQQADQYKQWWESRPDTAQRFGPFGKGFRGFPRIPRTGGSQTSPTTTPKTS